jgi:hypothetical protein
VGYLVTAADLFLTEVSAGTVGGGATLWVRSTTIDCTADRPVGCEPPRLRRLRSRSKLLLLLSPRKLERHRPLAARRAHR